MMALAAMTAVVLLALALLHVLWAAGVHWPIADEERLARAIAGFRNIDAMPPRIASALVALALLSAALVVLDVGLLTAIFPRVIVRPAVWLVALVFLSRGVVGFTLFWARLTPEQPFRRYDLRCYSPLCVAIGACIAMTGWSA